jgi:hypothetical protein
MFSTLGSAFWVQDPNFKYREEFHASQLLRTSINELSMVTRNYKKF